MGSLTKIRNADPTPRSQKGAILFIVAACLVVLLGFMGFAIDLGHAYNNKSQLQNMADACALAGATALNGTSAGIQLATDRARDLNANLNNKTEFNSQTLTLAETDVSFSNTLNGTYQNKAWAQGTPTTVKFVRVVIPPQPSEVVFAKVIPGIPDVINFGAEAVAGQHVVTEVCNGLDPFSPQAIDPNDTLNFGYQEGFTYMIRLATNGQGSGDTCEDFGFTNVVTGQFGFANVDPTCGGQGQGQNCFSNSLLNGSNRRCVGVNGTIPVQTGNFGINVIQDLQTRYNQDTDTLSHNKIDYLGSANNPPNYRRVLRVAFNAGPPGPGGSADYTILGYGCFWMASLPNAQPAAPICIQYFGQCTESGVPTGNNNSASLTQIVLFR
jgi:putative Flp pilus-assembly TadE/G-like protein